LGGTPEEIQNIRELAEIDAKSDESDDYMSGSGDEAGDHPSRSKGKKEEVFYTEGSLELKQARLEIAKYSLPKAQSRLNNARLRREKSIQEP